MRSFFSETKTPFTLFVLALLGHLVFFYALLSFYGPCSFFLSNDCTLNGNDTQHYVIDAFNLTHGHGYSRFVNAPFEPDALRTPLLPLYFAPFTFFGGYSLIWLAILLLNIVLSLAAVVAYKLARFFLPHGFALAAGFFMAFEPLYLYRSQIAEPDALFVLLVLVSSFFIVRSWRRGFAPDMFRAALFLGLAVLAKPTALYIALIMFFFEICYLLFFQKSTYIEKGKTFLISLCIMGAVVSPWVIRNELVFGVPALSSIQGYNLYEYYTKDLGSPAEPVPEAIEKGSREPSRYLPFQSYFTHAAFARIEAHPNAFMRELLVGSLRNLFVSDISSIFYYGHTKLLPFRYDPESAVDIHQLLLSGNLRAFFAALFSPHALTKLLWIVCLVCIYILACIGWGMSWFKERKVFLSFTMFLCLYGYLIFASGPYVDAKYRLPALTLIFIVALYGLQSILPASFLRGARK